MKLLLLIKPVIERFPMIATAYRSIRDQLNYFEKPKLTPWGFSLAGNDAMAEGAFEPIETELVRKLLEEVDVLVNVGANVGYYCCHALSMGKHVIAFEPIERNLRFLCKNIKANSWDGVEVFPIALSNKVGILEIYGGDTGASLIKGWADIPVSYSSLVPCSTMDVVLNMRLDGKKVLILVDIEGAEKWMLEGATKLLSSKTKPIWLIEIMTKDHQPAGVEINPHLKSIFQLFVDNGYQAFTADENFRSVSMDEVCAVSNGVLSFGTHNFIFRDQKGK